ncbi:MAG: type IV pilus secretin PilQ [Syntrophobacteraceae bacterium]|nr:type IV pilus secretin PilQ [Syntrophobacteraceae bacterium]
MRRQANYWTGTFPLILGLTLLLGCFLHSTEARSQGRVASLQAYPANPMDQTVTPDLQKRYTGKPISLDLMDADIRNVLRLMSQLTSTNIVVDPDVSGKVTLKVKDVPWDQVLDMVLSMNDLGQERNNNVIVIAKQAKLRQQDQQRIEAIKARQNLSETSKDEGDLTTVYFPVNFGTPADLASKIAENKSPKGKVSVDKRTSLIIYTDYPVRISNARGLLQRLDRPTPQVLIEARIITITSDANRQLGVSFAFSTAHSSTTSVPVQQNFFINPPSAGQSQFGASISQLIGKTLVDIDFQIQALQTLTLARIVAAPRVLTLDNVKATVTSGEEVPYLEVNGVNSTVSSTAFKDAVLELSVTPHITPDRKVRLVINAKQDTVSANTYSVGQSTEPGIDTRKIQTELLVADGNVVVIGGVINNQSNYTNTVTPGLSDIPILGRLFKSESSRDQKNELLIFISPKIVEPSTPYAKTS